MAHIRDDSAWRLQNDQHRSFYGSPVALQSVANAPRQRKFPFLAIALPLIAVATFGQVKTLDRLMAYFPSAAQTQLAALPVAPVEQQLLPPLRVNMASLVAPSRSSRTLFVRRGDTLQELLASGGVSWEQAKQVVDAIKSFYDPKKLHIGQKLSVTLKAVKSDAPAAADMPRAKPDWELSKIVLHADVGRDVVARLQPDGAFIGREVKRELTLAPMLARGKIDSSLFEAALSAGVPADMTAELVRLFSYDVDFQRDIQPNDRFEVLFDREVDANGAVARTGAIRYAALILSGEKKELFRYAPSDTGAPEYFNRNGHGAKKALMKTPLDGARLTSSFGMRKHPIRGYTRMHKGADFAAVKGAPVMAAGGGVIEVSGWNGDYGKYIRIRHNEQYQTAYAHLNGFGKGIRKGAHVHQGQVIGYSGSTGSSTGPHLHYEVLLAGAQVNPQSMKLPTARELKGEMLQDFRKTLGALDKERAAQAQHLVGAVSLR